MIGRVLALAAVLAAPVGAAPAQAETFKGADFLEWSAKGRNFYLETSIGMAGVIAAQVNSAQARCIDKWHSDQNEKQYPALLEAMRSYPAYHPQGVILAVLRKACGGFE